MSLQEIPRPIELLELHDGESIEIYPLNYVSGYLDIQTKDESIGNLKRIEVLRLIYDKDIDVSGLDYWDITSTTLIYQLKPTLDNGILNKMMLKITAFGSRPRTRFMVNWINSRV